MPASGWASGCIATDTHHLLSHTDRPTRHWPPTHGRIKDASESPSSQPHGPIRHGRTVHALISRLAHAAMGPHKGGFIFSLRIRPFDPKRPPCPPSLTHVRLSIHYGGVMTAPLGLGSVRPLPPPCCHATVGFTWKGAQGAVTTNTSPIPPATDWSLVVTYEGGISDRRWIGIRAGDTVLPGFWAG